ncbi:MAG: hypothetical protein WCK86_01155 [Planctomycetia bacterium]
MSRILLSLVLSLPVVPVVSAASDCAAPATPCERTKPCVSTTCPQNCQSVDCQVCGTSACAWDCTMDPGTDVDSLTLAAQSKRLLEASQAELRFTVPESAVLWLGNRKVSALGTKRAVRVPIFDVAKSYHYEARVEFVLDGKKYFRRIDIGGLQAGRILAYSFTIPELKEDDIPTIDFERQVLVSAR